MKPPLFIRPLTDDEPRQLEADRRTADAFRVRRAHIVLASARRLAPKPIAQLVGCSVQTVRHVIHALNTRGVEGLAQQSNRPKTVEPVLDAAHGDHLQHIWFCRKFSVEAICGMVSPPTHAAKEERQWRSASKGLISHQTLC